MRIVIAGMGEVGTAVHRLVAPHHKVSCVDIKDKVLSYKPHDVLFVCFPYRFNGREDFSKIVANYARNFKVTATVIFSTVPVGTCSELSRKCPTVHSPVEGRHPDLLRSLQVFPRLIGGRNPLVESLFTGLGLELVCLDRPEYTEFLKLRSTAYFGLCVQFARYTARVCDKIKMPYGLARVWDIYYNNFYRSLGLDKFNRPVLDPPDGPIGGHCVVPNAEMLDRQFPDDLLKRIYK